MDHVREQIAVAALAALTGLTTTGTRVFRDRDTEERPLQPSATPTEIPGLLVDDDGDPAELITIDLSQILERTMRLRVTAHVKKLAGYGAELNQILKEVEVAMAGAVLAGAKSSRIIEVGPREKAEGSDQPTLRQAFVFELVYYTAAGAPDIAL